jgi:hypothetical protein
MSTLLKTVFQAALTLGFAMALSAPNQAQAQTQTSKGVRYTCQSEWSFERIEMMAPAATADGKYSMKLTDITSPQDIPLGLKGKVEANQFDVTASENSLFSHGDQTRLVGKKNQKGEWTITWYIQNASNGDSVIQMICD